MANAERPERQNSQARRVKGSKRKIVDMGVDLPTLKNRETPNDPLPKVRNISPQKRRGGRRSILRE